MLVTAAAFNLSVAKKFVKCGINCIKKWAAALKSVQTERIIR